MMDFNKNRTLRSRGSFTDQALQLMITLHHFSMHFIALPNRKMQRYIRMGFKFNRITRVLSLISKEQQH